MRAAMFYRLSGLLLLLVGFHPPAVNATSIKVISSSASSTGGQISGSIQVRNNETSGGRCVRVQVVSTTDCNVTLSHDDRQIPNGETRTWSVSGNTTGAAPSFTFRTIWAGKDAPAAGPARVGLMSECTVPPNPVSEDFLVNVQLVAVPVDSPWSRAALVIALVAFGGWMIQKRREA